MLHSARAVLRFCLASLMLAALCGIHARTIAAQTTSGGETLRGVVRGADTVLIPNAQISVTPAGSGGTQSVGTRSNSTGRWTVVMPSRSASYFVTVAAIGWIQQRVAVVSNPNGPVLVDVSLKKSPVVLSTVRVVEARRQPVSRDFLIGSDVAQTEKGVLASSEVFGVADQGDLVGMIAQVPGVSLISDPNGGAPNFSVLGLSSSQNNITLNGLAFGGGDVPRDIAGAVRVTSASYDVSRGGFSGAQLSVTQGSGGNFRGQLAHVTVDGPALQATDQVGRSLGQQYSNIVVSGVATGPIQLDRLFYNVSAQGGRRQSDLRSLLNSDPFSLDRLGVAQDSVSAFVQAAQLVAAGEAAQMVAAGIEPNSDIVARIFGRLFPHSEARNDVTRSDVAAAVVVEGERHARERGARVLARVWQIVEWRGDALSAIGSLRPPRSRRAQVVLVRPDGGAGAVLERTEWSECDRACCAPALGESAALGIVALAVAAARVGAAHIDEALVLGLAQGRGYAIVLARE